MDSKERKLVWIVCCWAHSEPWVVPYAFSTIEDAGAFARTMGDVAAGPLPVLCEPQQ